MEMIVNDTNPATKIEIRRLQPEDAEAAAVLSEQLGYPVSPAELRKRIARLAGWEEVRSVFAACLGAELVGWIEVEVTHHLAVAPFVHIAGLVVKDGFRGYGIGKRLCEQAEAWTRSLGIATVRVTSRSIRLNAHRFYQRDGYVEIKTSKVFEKVLD
jgi:GNAT superfamily N-acetyltransferase